MLVLDERTRLVARKVTAFPKESGNRFQKAIVFGGRDAFVAAVHDLQSALYREVAWSMISAFAPPEIRGRWCESTNHRNRRHDSWKR